ncbi:hypothetical protein BSKO_07803 [Bryopsis sp. KO-2023]|nr:hypothetical protein BSKO_07803 [Bryopsis sp. KO-2023]
MEDAGAFEAVRACRNALERSIDNRFVVLTSACVDSICAVKILKESLEHTAPSPPTIRTVTNLAELKDAVAGEQLCGGPRVFFFVNCGGLEHEFRELDLMAGGVAIFLDNRRPVPIDDEPKGVEVRWMGFEGDHRRPVGTPSSLCALYFAQELELQSCKCLWYAILGQTDVAHKCGVMLEQIQNWQRLLEGQVAHDAWGISFGENFKLPFFQHTSLWESIRMSGSIMAKLGECWKLHNEELENFVVELGIPTEKSKIPYGTFMVEHGQNLDKKLEECGVQRGLHDLRSQGFKRKTTTGEVTAEDHALALRSALAAASGCCDLPSITEGTRSAMKILTGSDNRVKKAAMQYQKQMSSIIAAGYLVSRSRKQALRIYNLSKKKDVMDATQNWKCPFWLELLARHAMDYSNIPVLLIGLETENDRVPLVGWGNCKMEGTSNQQICPLAQMMLEVVVSMKGGKEDIDCVTFQTNMWWMKKKTAKEFMTLLVKKIQGG